MTEIESWRELSGDRIEFTIRRLPAPIEQPVWKRHRIRGNPDESKRSGGSGLSFRLPGPIESKA